MTLGSVMKALAQSLDLPRGTNPRAVGVHQQRHHDLRRERRPAAPVTTQPTIEPVQVQLLACIHHEPRQVSRRQPIAQPRGSRYVWSRLHSIRL